jgi:hypothetical protein
MSGTSPPSIGSRPLAHFPSRITAADYEEVREWAEKVHALGRITLAEYRRAFERE